ncbi:MAG: hypothetical protein ABR923_12590 [Terracidiphilus sp.]|jgi:hypothetical protein
MRLRQGGEHEVAPKPANEGLQRTADELDRKFWMALGLYGILAALAWFTLGEGSILVAGKPVELRLVPLLILGLFAFRTFLARQADKIRRESAERSSEGGK